MIWHHNKIIYLASLILYSKSQPPSSSASSCLEPDPQRPASICITKRQTVKRDKFYNKELGRMRLSASVGDDFKQKTSGGGE